jgi:ceramide synthetase
MPPTLSPRNAALRKRIVSGVRAESTKAPKKEAGDESDDEADAGSPLYVKPESHFGFSVYVNASKPQVLDNALTLGCAGLFLWCHAMLDATYLKHVWAAMLMTPLVVGLLKRIAPYVGSTFAHGKKWSKLKNRRKFRDQFWQLVVHTLMGYWEYTVVKKLGYWNVNESWESRRSPMPIDVEHIYTVQLGIWFFTAFSHRFLEARHKDYFVMFAHHFVTLFLVLFSWNGGFHAIGMLVLLVHDISDVPLDILKSSNYLGLDEQSGLYITEIAFVANMVSWAYARLYLFPFGIITRVLPPHCGLLVWILERMSIPANFVLTGSDACMDGKATVFICFCGLCALVVMHVWWFFLILRIAYRLIVGEKATDIAKDEYEGTSDDDSR